MVHTSKDIEEKVIQAINKQIGSKVENLHHAKRLIHHYKIELEHLETKLNIREDTQLGKGLSSLTKYSEIGDQNLRSVEEFSLKLRQKIEHNVSLINSVSENAEAVVQLQHLVGYFKLIRDIQDICAELNSYIHGTEEAKMVELYLSLCGDSYTIDNVLGRTFETDAPNLKLFARRTAFYWHDLLKEKFTKEFEKILKSLKWPQIELWNPSRDTLLRLQELAQFLFMVKIPGDKGLLNLKLTPYVICPPLTSPIEALLKSFQDRFHYHFIGNRETNRLDKPEWYLTQILAWANEKHIFVSQNFQLPAIKAGLLETDVRIEFIRGLVQFGVQKLCDDIELISDDDSLFSHLLDEILSFEQELDVVLGTKRPSDFPSMITVITQPQYLSKWLSIEEIFASEKMDFILTQGSPFECLEPSNTEKLKIPRCADQFIRLLDAIRERYCNLPQPSHRIKFLHLQMELIDNFQRRLVQLHNNATNNVNTVHILNALNYVIFVLREWGESVHYLHLLAALHGPHVEDVNSVFETIIKELEHWQSKLLKALAARVVDDIKAKSMPYRHDNWVNMPEHDPKLPMILSHTAGEMFQLLVTILQELENELSENLFLTCLRVVAKQLDDYFIDSMVMMSRFSTAGANQFNFDMTRNLFALFGLYTRNPAQLFKSINDACALLTLNTATGILLRDTMKAANPVSEKSKAALREVGVLLMEPVTALDILERRKDIC